VICRQTVGRQHGRSIAESIFLAFPFLLLHTLPSFMHVCSLSGSPCSDFLLHVLPRLSHVRVELLTTPIIVNTTNLASNHCLPACSCHSNTAYQSAAYTRPSNRPYFDTVLPRPLQNGNATRHISSRHTRFFFLCHLYFYFHFLNPRTYHFTYSGIAAGKIHPTTLPPYPQHIHHQKLHAGPVSVLLRFWPRLFFSSCSAPLLSGARSATRSTSLYLVCRETMCCCSLTSPPTCKLVTRHNSHRSNGREEQQRRPIGLPFPAFILELAHIPHYQHQQSTNRTSRTEAVVAPHPFGLPLQAPRNVLQPHPLAGWSPSDQPGEGF
jgi:hypothetical protein